MPSFATRSELRVLADLDRALRPHGYSISQKVRLLDALEAVGGRPPGVVGPSLLEHAIGSARFAAGPFGKDHPWLEARDWDYAFKAHLDFLVLSSPDAPRPNEPLFAVEFDGPSHAAPDAATRDRRKNRLCLASGLPLLRVDDRHFEPQDAFSLILWITECWHDYQTSMPVALAARDEAIEALSEEEMADPFWFAERPHLDVELVFRLSHPFPPSVKLARELAQAGFFYWPLQHELGGLDLPESGWSVALEEPLSVEQGKGFGTQRWRSSVKITPRTQAGGAPSTSSEEISSIYDVVALYPACEGAPTWDPTTLLTRPEVLPSGPFVTAPDLIGRAMCEYVLLRYCREYLRRGGFLRADPNE